MAITIGSTRPHRIRTSVSAWACVIAPKRHDAEFGLLGECDRDRREEVDLVFFLTREAWPHLKASRGVVETTRSLKKAY